MFFSTCVLIDVMDKNRVPRGELRAHYARDPLLSAAVWSSAPPPDAYRQAGQRDHHGQRPSDQEECRADAARGGQFHARGVPDFVVGDFVGLVNRNLDRAGCGILIDLEGVRLIGQVVSVRRHRLRQRVLAELQALEGDDAVGLADDRSIATGLADVGQFFAGAGIGLDVSITVHHTIRSGGHGTSATSPDQLPLCASQLLMRIRRIDLVPSHLGGFIRDRITGARRLIVCRKAGAIVGILYLASCLPT